MHYHWKTGQPCNCTFHKPYEGEPEYVEPKPKYIPRGDDSREIVGNAIIWDSNDNSD